MKLVKEIFKYKKGFGFYYSEYQDKEETVKGGNIYLFEFQMPTIAIASHYWEDEKGNINKFCFDRKGILFFKLGIKY